ncbi:hypothetical protein PENSPDRAFT_750794 [Peniophora sp. CONT]|nr:hypothetical protein PENSPDRAFT_750794 [Peniophora sp. CONT]
MHDEQQQWSIAQNLPADILCELYEISAGLEPFEAYMSSSNHAAPGTLSNGRFIKRDSRPGYIGWLRLMHICHSWRTAGIELCAKLWAGINILAVPYDALDTVLTRAGDLPLLATTGAWQSEREDVRDIGLVIQHIHRLKELNVFSAESRWIEGIWGVLIRHKDRGTVFERLETLRCQPVYYHDRPRRRYLEHLILNVPNLRRLAIADPYIPFSAPILTHLWLNCLEWANQYPGASEHGDYYEYHDALGTLVRNLRNTALLEDFELMLPVRRSSIMHDTDLSIPPTLPRLRRLRLAGHIPHCVDFLKFIGLSPSPQMSVRLDTSFQPDIDDESLYTHLFESILPGLQHNESGAFIIQPTHEPPAVGHGNAPGPHIGFGLVRDLTQPDAIGDIRVSVSPYGNPFIYAPPWQRRVVASAFFDTIKITSRVLDISRCDLWQELAPAFPDGVLDSVYSVTTDLVHCGFLRYAVCTRDPPLLPALREVVLVGVVEHPSVEQWQTGWASLNEVFRLKRPEKSIVLRRIKGAGEASGAVETHREVDREGIRRARELAFEVVDDYNANNADVN